MFTRSTTILSIAASALLTTFGLTARPAAAALATFEDLPVPAQGYYNGSDGAGGFTSDGVFFDNNYNASFGVWDGWSYSRRGDTTTPGFGNQYSAFPGGGSTATGTVQPGGTFGIGYGNGAAFNLPAGQRPSSVRLTNTTYAALSVRDGDAFAKKFGGPTGNDPDFFSVTLTGFAGANGTGLTTGVPVTFFLADYRSPGTAQDYVVSDWRQVDLTPLGAARSVGLTFASSDVGAFGVNTPTYVAADNLATVPVPEPAAGLALIAVGGLLARGRRHRPGTGRAEASHAR